jgi:AraC family transcriptional regulator
MASQAAALRVSEPSSNETLGVTDNVRVSLISDCPGMVQFTGSPKVVVCIHLGAPVYVSCRREGESHCGTTIHGDVDIIPPNVTGLWELKGRDTALIMGISLKLLRYVAEEAGEDPRLLQIRNRFQIRDARIEHIGWALKTEMENGYPCGRLYLDSLATGLAACLVRNHSSLSPEPVRATGAMEIRKLKDAMSFMEDNIGRDLSLREIAGVTGLSVSHFKAVFRRFTGLPVHQYLIHRRVDRAATLLRKGKLPISQIALEVGFCHQSHLALHMRRILGVAPRELKDGYC